MEFVQGLINYISENIDSVEKIIEIIGVLFGTPIALMKGTSAFAALISASKIEISFMTKKERMKLNITNAITMFVAFFFSNCICGYALSKYWGLCVAFLMLGIGVLFTLMIIRGYRIVRRIHCVRMFGFFIRKMFNRIKCFIRGMFKKKQCVSLIIKVVTRFTEKITQLWRESAVTKTKTTDKGTASSNVIESVFFIGIVIIEFSFNCCIWSAAIRQNVSIYVSLSASALLTFLLLEALFLLARKSLFIMEAKVYIYDENSKTPLYIFFKYDEKYCIAGNTPVLESASEYRLYKYDEIHGKIIYPVSILDKEKYVEKHP